MTAAKTFLDNLKALREGMGPNDEIKLPNEVFLTLVKVAALAYERGLGNTDELRRVVDEIRERNGVDFPFPDKPGRLRQ